jgi:hypothetical protein
MARKKDGIGDSPYEGGGKPPDRTMPSDRKQRAQGGVVRSKKTTSNSITYKLSADTSGWSTVGMTYATAANQMRQYIQQISSYSTNPMTFITGVDSREKEFASLGFAAGVVRGVRSFLVDELGRLTGVAFKKVWLPGENQAKCYAENRKEFGDFGEHMPDCLCGFYAYYDGSNDYRQSETTITAVVEGYGSTVIGSRGFRCAKARIVALHIPDDVKRSGVVSRNYAEIPQFDTFLRMVKEFPPIGDEKTVSPDDEDFWTREA